MQENFLGCQAIVYNHIAQQIASGPISYHDRRGQIITVQGGIWDVSRGDRLSVLIVRPNVVDEFDGRAGRGEGELREIMLYNVRRREGRSADRYTINAPAIIKNVYIGSKQQPFMGLIRVVIRDMSKTGISVKAPARRFKTGMALQLSVKANDRESLIYVTVVREEPAEGDMSYYGCKFMLHQP
ncbi:MAG: PilZ domain-containing protein [Oscillospiraceae bacterium]|nr:PilZ domain-containing protein [Oscillospiraceae bacterium]